MVDSALLTGTGNLVTLLEATTPPSETNVPYRYLLTERDVPDGASSHRKFWFVPGSGEEGIQFDPNGAFIEHLFELRVRYSTAGTGVAAWFTYATNDAVTLMRAINRTENWGNGVPFFRAISYSWEALPSDDFELVLSMRARCLETP